MDHPRPIHVAAGVLIDSCGRVLVAQRPIGSHQGGLWEFPGGKVELGETPRQALARELKEEIGIVVSGAVRLIRVQHQYQDRCVVLNVYRVEQYAGEPQGREGQAVAWVHPESLEPSRMPAADRPVIMALRLPDCYVITGPTPHCRHQFFDRLARSLDQGHRMVQLRAHDVDDKTYSCLAREAQALCAKAGARLLLNRDPKISTGLKADGLHLTATHLRRATVRPVPQGTLVGASCHTADELAHAQALGLDYAVLSPVNATASHPHAVPLGWDCFSELVARVSLPVYALGGLTARDVDQARAAGGQGVAGIGGFWPDSQSSSVDLSA